MMHTAILLLVIVTALLTFMLGALLLNAFSSIRGKVGVEGSPRGACRQLAPVPVRSRQVRAQYNP